jgi:hypothetical protein
MLDLSGLSFTYATGIRRVLELHARTVAQNIRLVRAQAGGRPQRSRGLEVPKDHGLPSGSRTLNSREP